MHDITIPIQDPVLIFTIILFIILIVPVILRKTNVPSIVGLIIVGIIIGPHATNFIGDSEIVELFGKVGLLYIMFLAGLEIEFVEFRKNSVKGIFFGLATFVLPFAFGYYGSIYILELEVIPSVLIGALLASHTLVAFPAAGKLGITKTSAVNTAISGTVIADTLVLIILAFVTALLNEGNGSSFLWLFFLSFSIFTFSMFYLLPKLSSWFFRTVTTDGNLQYLFALAVLFASSFAAELAGAEPIIGAFFAGLAMNRLIPSSSSLMNRIEFVGNTLFIPVFLISVGMLVNLQVLLTGYLPAVYAAFLIVLAIGSKWVAAWLTKLIFRQSKNEMNTIFGLTSARAAATLAVALVGYEYGVLNKDIFNGTILLIMITSLFSSYVTERAGKKLALEESNRLPVSTETETNRILVPIANPNTIEKLIDLAILLHDPRSKEPIYPLAVVKDDEEARKRILANKPVIEKIAHHAAASGVSIQGMTRVDVNTPDAIIRASKELMASEIVLGWGGKTKELGKVFGGTLEVIVNGTGNTVVVSHLPLPLNTTQRILVTVPENAEKEAGFQNWLNTLVRLSNQLSAPITFYTLPVTRPALQKAVKKYFKDTPFIFTDTPNLSDFGVKVYGYTQPLYVFINARPHTISYDQNLWDLTFKLPESLQSHNTMIIYPRQYS